MTLSFDPRTGRQVPAPADSTPAEVDAIVDRAALPEVAPAVRAGWLESLAAALDAETGRLATLADEEVALGLPRLTGEAGRAAQALRFYAATARDGGFLGATIETGVPDLRRMGVPLGPVAVFGASNFPFGFGVLGHDTASALAAGCPVVVKAHPAHPRLSATLADLARTVLPAGAFALVSGFPAGQRLVGRPGIKAVAFTGSQRGGLALWRLANERDEVIPVFAEMGTVNTAVVTAAGAAERADAIAAGFVASFTLGMGQFCTKPGLLLAPAGAGLPGRVAAALSAAAPRGWLLTAQIAEAYDGGVSRLLSLGARELSRTPPAATGWSASAAALSVDARRLRLEPALLEECFGPVALVAEYADERELDAVLDVLPGSLATAVQGAESGDPQMAGLVARLSRRCGRVVVNGWPTGVAVSRAQQHGGPWPATTSPAHTSVGGAALQRFLRPVTFQDVPDEALPPALRAGNPWGIAR